MGEKQSLKLDVKEIEFPETVFSRDIETRVIQVIILHCLAKIEGVSLLGGNLIDTLFGRDIERMKGIYVEQDTKNHLVKVKVEVNVEYGVSIPEKTDEIQGKVVSEISEFTGLHVASVHVIIKGLSQPKDKNAEDAGREEIDEGEKDLVEPLLLGEGEEEIIE
ncbi:Asp23/Gls24 family envelope stress response protein [Chlamydiifrater volucris]|uniref:Asp23/Gls24 family envelope stress response protein n=1 Tax=Chlamydiifrater volucris TaxID=2681470 RepID=UPI003CCE96B5